MALARKKENRHFRIHFFVETSADFCQIEWDLGNVRMLRQENEEPDNGET
jgi:hypothetical protein